MDIVLQHKNAANDENTIYDYTSMPPPPYSKSTSSHNGATALIKPKQAIKSINSISLSASNVKDYIARLKGISPVSMSRSDMLSVKRERNMATTTDSYTENTKPSIHEPTASSSSPFIEQNTSTGESNTMNDSLERIGTSLQLLIEEAQASLLTTSSHQLQPQETKTIVDYSYRYVQHGYLQSQEKLALAIEKLEQSIHSVVYTASMQQQTIKNYYTTTHHHHYYAATTYPSSTSSVSSSSQPAPSFDRSKLWIMGMVLIFIGYSLQPYYKIQHAKASILLLTDLSSISHNPTIYH
ncbi:hypothetical protein V8B55DRAFT_1577712 [Mucor lusitanicus]|uniref:Uncharacterized protein n=2 Tax=Mucor circinelloides f. lusitanicus TaxID=29924 RepID=A0A162RAU0_MUCCL|nr:hypothetical protein FB192DRAFT_1345514 [Mucor lusitanicus]OAD03819.1 hypothetical protein MUCCIDRAFT_110698 [Mucor lusitanicus CBS 277.49]